ncbi:MAG: hypothetical protein ACYS9C_14255 [Planctomycetota bacterium]
MKRLIATCVLVKGQWDHCRTAEYTTKVIEKFIHVVLKTFEKRSREGKEATRKLELLRQI